MKKPLAKPKYSERLILPAAAVPLPMTVTMPPSPADITYGGTATSSLQLISTMSLI